MSEKSQRQPRRHGGPHAMGAVEKAKDAKATLKKLGKYMEKYMVGLVLVVICSIGSTIFNIIGPKKLSKATNLVAAGLTSENGIDFHGIEKIMSEMILLYVISWVLGVISGQIVAVIAQKTTYRMRKDISDKIHKLPMNFFDTRTHGETLSIIVNDVDTMGMSLSQSVQQLVTSVTSVIGIIVMMLSINVIMTLVAIVVLPISAVLVSVVVKMSQKHFKNQQAFLGNVNGIVEETFSGQNVVKAFNKEEDILKEFNQSNKKLYEANFKSQFLSGLMMPLMMFVGNLAYVVICVLGGYLVVNGSMQVGAIQAFIGYIRNFTQPISQLAQVSNMIQTAIAAGERVFEFLENEDENETGTKSLENIKGDIDFINVTFGYTPEKIIIKDFNYSVKAGQKVAIVGETGAGKTTIVKLLMRFYDVNSGEILIDGVNINEYKRSELRKFFGMVLQDTWLFQGTIMENLRYGRLDATDDEIIEIAKFSHAHRFISSLPDGYNTVLNEEATNISIGQKQLLTIARCYLAKSSVIILDEATSSVDTRTEWRIQRAMQKMTLGKTSFIIAHRLSTIRDADCLIKF